MTNVRLAARLTNVIHSPIGAAHALVPQRSGRRSLLDLSQAAPSFPPAPAVTARIAEVVNRPDSARYAPQPGLPELRAEFASDLNAAYQSNLQAADVLITPGCNEAFCLAISVLLSPGDVVVIPVPYYFNHDMWLRVEGIEVRYWDGDPGTLDHHLDHRVRAVVVVSPGNPTGVTVPPAGIRSIATTCRGRGVAVILDETYRTYRPTIDRAHDLYADADWADHVVTLHSFSKEFAIPGYRVGALVGHPDIIAQALKWLDCVSICTSRIGQEAALAGLRLASEWRSEVRDRIAGLRQHFAEVMAGRPGGFALESSGAYFGWVRHPYVDRSTSSIVRDLIIDHDTLAIPGVAFTPRDHRFLRLSVANLDHAQLDDLAERLAAFRPGMADLAVE